MLVYSHQITVPIQGKTYTGQVTKLLDNFGFIDDSIFFPLRYVLSNWYSFGTFVLFIYIYQMSISSAKVKVISADLFLSFLPFLLTLPCTKVFGYFKQHSLCLLLVYHFDLLTFSFSLIFSRYEMNLTWQSSKKSLVFVCTNFWPLPFDEINKRDFNEWISLHLRGNSLFNGFRTLIEIIFNSSLIWGTLFRAY